MPLMLSSAVETDDTWQWWLLDSGASVSVLAEHFQQYYRCKFDEGGALQQAEYRAANGSAVKMSSQNVTVYVALRSLIAGLERGARHSSRLAHVWEGSRTTS